MKPGTEEWVKKAETDFDVVELLRRSRKPHRFDPICFNAQQCIEKYLKARLYEAGVPIPYIHDLTQLLKLCLPLEPLWEPLEPSFKHMKNFGVAFRYPGEWADPESAAEAYKTCVAFRGMAREALDLPVHKRRRR